jgi:pilus assembly protein CpaE
MTTPKIEIGILAPTPEAREVLSGNVESTSIATVKVLTDEYCAVEDDQSTQRFLETEPDIILVDMQDSRAAIKALYVLHAVLPQSWLYACSGVNDPQLIIETMHAGAREYLAKPVSSRSLSMAFTRYLEEKERQRKEGKVRGKVYGVTSAKGGAGATSVAVNVATTLADLQDTKVALIDLNSPIGDAASYLDLKPQFSVSDALHAAPRLDPTLLETFMCTGHKVSVLPGPKQLKPGPTPLPAALAKLLRVASQSYTHTLVDLPSSLDQDLLEVITDSSEAVLVVMTPELPALWRTHRLLLILAGLGCSERVRLILNRDNSRAEIDEREIRKALNHPIYWRLPNNYSSAIQAINKGKPIVWVNHSGLASSYRKLTHELTGVPIARPRGLLKLFR